MTWPLFKACEPPTIWIALAILGTVAVLAPTAWIAVWRGFVGAMAILAPILAVGRAARAVRGDSPGAEFGRWFRPLGG